MKKLKLLCLTLLLNVTGMAIAHIDFTMEELWIENGVTISVFLNSADSPEDVHVVLSQDIAQASLNTMGDDELEIVLDETGYYVWEHFRKGTYYVEISMEGFETIHDTVTISSDTDMRYVMTESPIDLPERMYAPENIVAYDSTVFNDEQITISWDAITNPGLQKYYVYRDGEWIAETTANTYTDGPLAYNMIGYEYYVTAVNDAGESDPSDTVTVQVSGYGFVSGYVYGHDGQTGIADVTVSLTGTDEFGDTHTYSFTTNSNGYYSSWPIYAGSYNVQASRDGLPFDLETNTPIVIHYNQGTQANFHAAKISDITLGDLLYSINADSTSVTIMGLVDCPATSGTLTIPASITYQGKSYAVTAIGKDAFSGCTNFDNIFSFVQTPPTLGSNVFGGWNTNIPVTVPCGSGEAYSSIQWGGFSNFIEDCQVPSTVIPVDNDAILQGSGKWFTIDGHELPSEPAQGGLYIHDGSIILFKP